VPPITTFPAPKPNSMPDMHDAKLHMQLQCPLPALDTDIVTLGHGSGGLLTNRLLDQGVFRVFQNETLQRREDGAVVQLKGPTAFTTDSFVVSPIFFPGGDIGDLAINGTVNDLAMCGARPKYLSLSFILEEGLPIADFWKVLVSIKFAAEQAGAQVVTGDTKVVERGKGDQIFINTTGLGPVHERARLGVDQLKPGDRLLVSGPLAKHGMAIMSVREGLEFDSAIQSDTRPLHEAVWSCLEAFGPGVRLLRDPTRGGLATVLNEIARDSRLGLEVSQERIPVHEQEAAACELLGLDPLYVANEGLFLAVVAPDIGEQMVEQLRRQYEWSEAALIGEVVAEHAGQVILRSAIGGRRVVQMLAGEQLPRIC